MSNILGDFLREIIGFVRSFVRSFFPPIGKTEKETRRGELKEEEAWDRDAFEQRNYSREEKRTGVVDTAKEKQKKVW